MTDKATLSHLKNQFYRLSRERQAEVLGMAKAFTFAQQATDFDLRKIVQKIVPDTPIDIEKQTQ
jgi:hypothetical protein